MKAEELRIGNYVNYQQWRTYKQGVIRTINNGSCNITSPGDSSPIDTIKFKMIEPIPLTELWFEKFGFKSIGLNGQVFEHKNLIGGENRFVIETDCNIFYPKINFDDCCFGEFKYVHQLQNLYFVLTGNELTII